MGSPLSPIIADIVLQDIEQKAIEKILTTLGFYYRYVDDIVSSAPREFMNDILNIFNSFHPRIQFTLELGNNDQLNFLDITIFITNGRIEFDWFHKPTFSGRYLNYYSHHPECQKRGTIYGKRYNIWNG